MSCKCFHCVNTILVGTDVVLSFNTSPTVKDESRFCFRIYDDVPSTADALSVYISVNGANVPIWNKYGNALKGIDLRKCKVYKGYYTSQGTAHVIVENAPVEY